MNTKYGKPLKIGQHGAGELEDTFRSRGWKIFKYENLKYEEFEELLDNHNGEIYELGRK